MANRLLEPLLANGIRNTNYFNGRILNADDLQTDQAANRFQHWQLGRALGEGVAYGLEVTVDPKSTAGKSPVLNVRAGLAINRRGQMLELRVNNADSVECPPAPATGSAPVISLELTDVPIVSGSGDAGLFGTCAPGTTAATPLTGVYVLILSPTSGFSGRAPIKSLSLTGKDAGCGSRWAVEGVTFRLAPFLDPSEYPDSAAYAPITDINDPRLQNRLAHLCFGTEKLLQAGPFATPAAYGALDAMRGKNLLTDCDVPLALLYLSGSVIQFCDMWAVRRPVVSLLAEQTAPVSVGHRRLAEAVALFRQFQDQIDQFKKALSGPQLTTLSVTDRFRFLPPGGYLAGLVPDTFFAPFGGTVNKLHAYTLDASEFRLLLTQSWLLDPIDLTQTLPDLNVYTGSGSSTLFVRGDHSTPVPVIPPAPAPGAIAGTAQLALSRQDIADGQIKEAVAALTFTATDAEGKTHQGKSSGPQVVQTVISFDFSFEQLPPGRYVVQAQAPTLYGERSNVRVASGETTRIFFPIFQEEVIIIPLVVNPIADQKP